MDDMTAEEELGALINHVFSKYGTYKPGLTQEFAEFIAAKLISAGYMKYEVKT